MKELTIEEWRSQKMPVQLFPGKVNGQTGESSIDFYKDKSWLYESAKMLNGWVQGEVLTEAQFDEGIERALGHVPGKVVAPVEQKKELKGKDKK